MSEHVLAVTCAILQATQQVHNSLVQSANLRFLHGFFSCSPDLYLDFLLSFGNQLFDSRGMDAAVGDELVQRDSSNFPSNRIVSAYDHHARCVVDNYIHAGGLLEGADVATLAADDAALHFVVWNIDGAGGGFGSVRGGKTLQRRDQHLLGLGIDNGRQLLFLFQDERTLLM